MTKKKIEQFRNTVYEYYAKNKRDFLWRKTRDPYAILISEIMLQQTQTDRVVSYYVSFLEAFPTVDTLAKAPLSEVLRLWQGLGYNRRAKYLHNAAQEIVQRFDSSVPMDPKDLESLPGIGAYTTGAIRAFAFDHPSVVIETNIRSVYLHHFFPNRQYVTDAELLPIIEITLDTDHPRRWYSALMDYGAHIKSRTPNPSRRSAHHVAQSRFKGSDREIRGAILRTLIQGPLTRTHLLRAVQKETGAAKDRAERMIQSLQDESMVAFTKRRYHLAH